MGTFEKILITRLRFIGDIVLTTPVIRAVRKKFPNSYIAYLADKNAITLLENNPYLDELIPLDFSWTLKEQLNFIKTLRTKKFDLVIDLFGNPRSAILSFLSGAKTRIGGEFGWRKYLYTHPIPRSEERKNAIKFHLDYLKPIGITFSEPLSYEDMKTEIFLSHNEKSWATEYLKSKGIDLNKKTVGIHPGATWPAKMWFKENFAELANRIALKLNANVIITHSENETELAIEVFNLTSRKNIFVLDALNLRQLASVLSLVDLYISNDCGPMHISVAVGTKTIGIFGPGEEDIWFPYPNSEGHKALRVDVECHPCHLDFCNKEGENYMKCMKLLTVDMVFNEVVKLLKRG
ncbi:lipopolysaccharide heptosyltransferase II [Candidatus Kryptonium thompsonii]|uniref:Lipopolysaccharide heptosyltransferase II n=1 Tax=Candidatus Kryptonium thompsonii TaxID=1633631 RepID=A0A0P1LHH6_9BACT|nr:glycosyltransferase family 9 protein [Candidatus Kryptonium thompsoni]CUS79079.1 lipopolysaccharide heptosyltransferase II [Candidatus Kryptonium thompsoni]CUS81001.1 lipopolysaccharide heptosyltransferase II [Candidatus Kryptonium thompsoni]CUS87923.1 lipopolysaccharide heptosyltransferase II [Candidatus Kryptonium thompsoni]CUS91994.1 lipopolysaccharide heptosyltransferase II [Candidatus Kryptonium thompsoni]CUS96667.1 lipopolysaccharide heptosyltransferase II [Candidatus Kryptonium thomp